MTSSASSTPKSYHTDPTLYLYTSLTAGSSHIITATSRLETILKANKIPFQALDVATDEKARMLWGRRAGKKKLPGLVRLGMIVGDLEEVEEWNEYGEVKDNLQASAPKPASTPSPSATNTPSKPPSAPATSTPLKTSSPSAVFDSSDALASKSTLDPPSSAPTSTDSPFTTAMRQAGFEAAKKAGDAKTKSRTNAPSATKGKEEGLNQLDQSGATGNPKQSGTIEAEDAMKMENAAAKDEDKAVNAIPAKQSNPSDLTLNTEAEVLEGIGQAPPSTTTAEEAPTSQEAESAANEAIRQDKSHVMVVGQGKTPIEGSTPEGMTPTEDRSDDEEEVVKEGSGSGLKNEVSATDEGEEMGGKRTQEQKAGAGEEVGMSVGD